MDEFLTELYGTNGGGDTVEPVDEMEKMAQYRLLEKIAADEGVDLDQLTEEEVEELATELANDLAADDETADQGETYEQDAEEETLEKEAQAKFEESDFLGRVMAHAMWQELGEIEKTAASTLPGGFAGRPQVAAAHRRRAEEAKTIATAKNKTIAEGRGKKAWEGVKRTARHPISAAAGAGEAIHRGAERLGRGILGTGGKATRRGAWLASKMKPETVKRLAQATGYAAPALGAAGLTAGGYAAYKAIKGRKEKKSSAFDSLVEERAYQHLLAAGLADEQGNIVTPDQLIEKTAGDDIDVQVDRAALEYLQELGYPVEWYEQQ